MPSTAKCKSKLITANNKIHYHALATFVCSLYHTWLRTLWGANLWRVRLTSADTAGFGRLLLSTHQVEDLLFKRGKDFLVMLNNGQLVFGSIPA